MAISVLSLLGIFVALYLLLWKIGVLGELSCTTSGCETVQTSAYSDFLGVPVALYGVVGFVALFVVSLVGLQPRWLERREPTILVTALSGVGVVFSAYLTYLEASVIHAWCQWCVASAVIIAVIFALSLLGLLTWQKSKNAA
jgi:uncharacterized membrane protein